MSDGNEAVDPVTPSPVALLLVVQDEDLRSDQLGYRLAHLSSRARLDELAAEERTLGAERRRIAAERVTLDEQVEHLEREVAECVARTAAIERRLRTAEAGSFRDQEAMAAEIGTIAQRRERLENEQMEVLEALEPLERAMGVVEESEQRIDDARAATSDVLAAEVAELIAERALVTERRAAAAAVVPTALRTEYERLRVRLAGIGVARLVHGSCTGCNLSLSATELDRIRRGPADQVVHCDQCGRILVP